MSRLLFSKKRFVHFDEAFRAQAFGSAVERNSWYKAMTLKALPVTYGKTIAPRASQSKLAKDAVKESESWVVVDDAPENWIPCSVVVTQRKLRLLKENHSTPQFLFVVARQFQVQPHDFS